MACIQGQRICHIRKLVIFFLIYFCLFVCCDRIFYSPFVFGNKHNMKQLSFSTIREYFYCNSNHLKKSKTILESNKVKGKNMYAKIFSSKEGSPKHQRAQFNTVKIENASPGSRKMGNNTKTIKLKWQLNSLSLISFNSIQ